MKIRYTLKYLCFFIITAAVVLISSCSKDKSNNNNTSSTPVTATPANIGVYGVDSVFSGVVSRELLIAITKIGTVTQEYDLLFDTGSGGMVLDANGIIPSSMITSSGISFTGDSTVVNGITVTNQTSMIEYGADSASLTKVYGNLAYAPVTVGDVNGNVVIKRLPFFLYYKAVDAQGNTYDPHYFDVFGVDGEYDTTFPNGVNITSPFSFYVPGTGLTSGFKMASLTTGDFSYDGVYNPVITLGLTSADLSSSSAFNFNQLYFYAGDGYPPVIQTTIIYNSKTVTGQAVFDTGTEPDSYIEDPAAGAPAYLAPKSTVSLSTTTGFSYNYTVTASDNGTYVENPNTSGGGVSILSLNAIIGNSYLLDYTDHKLGLKNN
jgi:hypothetical protein